MKRKNEGEMTGGMLLFIFLAGGSLYLLMKRPVIFWLVFVPLAALLIYAFVKKCSDTMKGK